MPHPAEVLVLVLFGETRLLINRLASTLAPPKAAKWTTTEVLRDWRQSQTAATGVMGLNNFIAVPKSGIRRCNAATPSDTVTLRNSVRCHPVSGCSTRPRRNFSNADSLPPGWRRRLQRPAPGHAGRRVAGRPT